MRVGWEAYPRRGISVMGDSRVLKFFLRAETAEMLRGLRRYRDLRYNLLAMIHELPTPAILLDGAIVRRNIARMAEYAQAHRLKLRPHTKTHKSKFLARLQ